jgi:ectoine hydroxylase-related dioxygenase (phytanoyl-CoA dioxygenase family)
MTTASATVGDYERDGFCCNPVLYGAAGLAAVRERIAAVRAGEYETGVAAIDYRRDRELPRDALIKIDQPHRADNGIRAFITAPALGDCIRKITGRSLIQVWASQLLIKPSGGEARGNVGWHQDFQYWQHYWRPDSELLTAWIAISDVDRDCGPMRMVRGSHRWGFRDQGNFFDQDETALRDGITVPDGAAWEEVDVLLPAGAVSLHDRLTYHGSGPNRSGHERVSLAVHLRTEHSAVIPDSNPPWFAPGLDDPLQTPVVQ